ncbi:MAG: hypothetical protein QOI57_3223, partial [Rubrobacteraceae bacterium]|nr:hypothetical protein [Rubrobacteraceae bacterium]
ESRMQDCKLNEFDTEALVDWEMACRR